MNVLGHTFVALAAGRDDPEWLLGAVLPDLAPMAGVRVARDRLDGALGEGVRCHVRADEVFHAHPSFRAGSGRLRRSAAERGVPRGAARAVGHAGWELLLDAALLGAAAEEAFHRAVAMAGPSASTAMTDDDARRWAAFLARAARSGISGGSGARDRSLTRRGSAVPGSAPRLRYDEPRWVAERLHGMLARRPRLALPVADVPAVADVLAEHAGAVAAVASTVLDDTARATHAR